MKLIIKPILAILLFTGYSVSMNNVYGQASGSILDLIPLGAFKSQEFVQLSVFICKEDVGLPLECGDGSGGFIDNFYVVFIDIDETPAQSALLLSFVDDASLFISKEHCAADSIERTVIGFSDLPESLRDTLTIPDGKKAVFHRVRVTNGNGALTIRISQQCEQPQPNEE